MARALKEICAALSIPFVFKSSYDKANRSSSQSFRGVGMQEGLRILSEVKRVGVSVTHEGKEYSLPIAIGEFELASKHLLTRTEHTLVEMLEKNKLRWGDVDRILLVGGSSRMPESSGDRRSPCSSRRPPFPPCPWR